MKRERRRRPLSGRYKICVHGCFEAQSGLDFFLAYQPGSYGYIGDAAEDNWASAARSLYCDAS